MVLRRNIAAHSTELPATGASGTGLPDWVHLLPLGTFHGRDGRGPYTLRDAAHASEVIAATRKYQGGADIPGDFDHQILFAAQNGQPAPASGWIKEMDVRADGLWGRVEWSASGSERLGRKEYRYLSPVFNHDKAGVVTRIRAFALTNMPNLELTALASQSLSDREEDPMDEVAMKALLKALGLPETTTAEALSAHCQKLDTDAKAAKVSLAAIAKSLGQAEDATGEVLAAAAQDVSTKAKANPTDPDPAKFVPMSAFEDLQGRVAAMSTQLSGDKVAQAVATAKADGKLAPAQEEWAKSYATKDLDGFIAWASAAPVIVTPSHNRQGGGAQPPANLGANGLTAEETAVCSQIGITPEQFKKTRENV
ncbi:phage protease [Dongia sp.]|uniref:phage protease n=1 Tax=Dongia sp. TaxID=1977262 RepID=UPI0035B4A8A1